MILKALSADPRFHNLGPRKAVAIELIVREVADILEGDANYPSHWSRIIDICRQETGEANAPD
jgi:hypothetical protein